jgi:thiamine transport system permease protein
MDRRVDRSDGSLNPRNQLPRTALLFLAAGPVLVVVGFYLIPVVALSGRFLSLDVLRNLVNDASLHRVLWFTMWQAGLSTALTMVIGVIPAYVLARFEFRGRRQVLTIITVPFVMPTVVIGAAFAAMLGDGSRNSVAAILVAHVLFNVAVVVRGVGGLWEQLPTDLSAAARTLGASSWQILRHVTLPLLRPALVAATSVVFLFTFTSFGVVRILGGPAHPTLEVEIWQRATRLGDIGGAAALSVIQLVILGCAVAWSARIQRRRRNSLGLQPLAWRRRVSTNRQRVCVGCVVSATVAAVAVPIGTLIEGSMRTGSGHSLQAWRAVLGSAPVQTRPGLTNSVDAFASITVSLKFAVFATVISVVIGLSAACAIVGLGRVGALLDVGLMLPLATSAVTIGFGLLITFDTPPFDWRGAPLMIPLGHALVAIPFVVRLTVPVLRSIDPQLRAAAQALGASPLRVLWEIDIRFIRRTIVASAGFAAAISLGEFGATSFLTRQGRQTLPIAIDQLLNRPGALLHAQGYVLATVLALLTFVALSMVDGLDSISVRHA